ncbi:glucosamine-6-phosphate deaminase [Sediminibacillus dalangtanensis]|uniref:Glucosamine-6-phosphate deaminase n=1 Tax=Sediminibacillus dalangtanensis TaxID=2729421 RepID=A0ABX7VWJ0_9BACI|nr:glucosamine-6-phosphate deaminase [Sediminibacillus dalangtanensis]QTN00405.1 glucosamine-6-phosphate deaminase [Sediminibacillus dalangtanensis]
MEIKQVEDYQAMSEAGAQLIMETVNSLEQPVLGLATGSTPEGVYKRLIEAHQREKVSFRHTTSFNLDEYVGMSGSDPNSYRYFMDKKFFDYIDIDKQKTFVPNGKAEDLQRECEQYEQLLMDHQEIDLQLLGIGTNGHIGFNEPGTPFSTKTHIVDLAPSTRKANARFFESEQEVPKQAITMGIATIMKSKQIVLLVSGERKARALDQLLHGDVSEDFPASILQTHPNVQVIADKAALSRVSV